jgi:hypothetical protein
MGSVDLQNSDKIKKLPEYLQWILIFIDRAGFPVLAFFAILALTVYNIKSIGSTVTENTKALATITASINEYHVQSRTEHQEAQSCLNSLLTECRTSKQR